MRLRNVLVMAAITTQALSCSDDPRLMNPSLPPDSNPGAGPPREVQARLAGNIRVGIVLVHLDGTPDLYRFDLHPEYVAQIEQMMFESTPGAISVHNLYQEMSFLQDGFTHVDTYGPYTVDEDYATPCPPSGFVSSHAQAFASLAADPNYDPNDVDLLIYVFNGNNRCDNKNSVNGIKVAAEQAASGKPEVGVYNWDDPVTYAHEIGHHKGWGHSGIPGGTVSASYDDHSCVMGNNYSDATQQWLPLRQANVVWKYGAGYIRDEEIIDITTPGTHAVYLAPTQRKWDSFPVGAPGTLYHAARITVPPDVYYISYRRGDESAFDSDPQFDDLMNRVHIHRTNANVSVGTTRVAMLEANDSFEGETFVATAVTDGLDPGGAAQWVEVTVNVYGKDPAGLTLTPLVLYAHNESAGPTLETFTLRITNPDPPGTPASIFSIVVDVEDPGAFTIALQDTVTLAAGSFVQMPVQLNFASPPAEGPHSFTITVDEEVGRGPSSVSGTYWNDLTPPPAPANLVGVASVSSITLTWDFVVDLGVRYEILKNGSSTLNSNSTTYVDEDVVANQTYQYMVRAIDGAGNIGPWSPAIQVTMACTNDFMASMTSGSECVPLAFCRTTPLSSHPYGAVASFTLEIENMDPPSCGAATLNVSTAVNSDQFSFSGLAAQQNVAGGATVSDPFQIHFIPNGLPPDPLVEGRYSFSVTVSDAVHASPQIIPIQFIYDTAPPTQPGSLAATLTMSDVTLDWTASTDAATSVTGYEVFRDGQSLGTTTALTFTDANVISDCATYEVVARDEVSHQSAAASVDVGLAPIVTIDPPSLVTNNASPGFTLTIGNADGSGCPPGAFVITPSTSPNFTVTTATGQLVVNANSEGSTTGTLAATSNGVHSFMITVTDASTERMSSVAMATYTIDTVAPTAPSNLNASVIGFNQVRLKWKVSSDALAGVAYYEIERDGGVIATATGLSFVDNVDIMQSHTYHVRAYDHAGNASAWSPAATSGPTPSP